MIAENLPNSMTRETRGNLGRTGAALLTLGANQDVNAANLASTLAIENNFNSRTASQAAQKLSEDTFVQQCLQEYETKHGSLSQEQRTYFESFFRSAYYKFRILNLGQDILNPGLKLLEECANKSQDEIKNEIASHADPAFLSTAKGQRELERISSNMYNAYQSKQADLSLGSLLGVLAGSLATSRLRVQPIQAPLDAGIRWGGGIEAQGIPWENYLSQQLPGTRLPKNFKTFDFYDRQTRTAISAKTLNTQTPSKLADPQKVYYSLKKNIDAAAGFEEHVLNKV